IIKVQAMIYRLLIIALFTSFSFNAWAKDINLVDTFAKLPRFADIRVSPDGSKFLMLRPIGGTNHLSVMDMEKKETKLVLAAKKEEFTLRWCQWANNERILCSALADSGGSPFIGIAGFKITRLMAINYDGSNFLLLRRRLRASDQYRINSQLQDGLLSILPDNPAEVLIQVDRDKQNYPSVYRLNIYNNKATRVLKYKTGILRWYNDWQGNIRLGIGIQRNKPVAMAVNSEGSTQRLDISGLVKDLPPSVLGITPDGAGAYVSAYTPGSDRLGLHIVDLATAKLRETLVADPVYDFSGQIFQTDTVEPIAATWFRDEPQYKWFDDRWEKIYSDISQSIPNVSIRLVSANRDRTKLVIQTSAHNKVPHWYIYDHKARQLISFGEDYILPKNMKLASVKPITYKARDELEIHAYLTLPSSYQPDMKLPTIIFPHGGPFARDAQIFNYWLQFMAMKGYAVLQPNFRGSAGYGNVFLTACFKEWGKAMQTDVLDGLDWLIQEGITDPEKVCIVGGSYGGYVALTAAWQTPEKFKCGVSFAGVADLPSLVRNLRFFQLGELTIDRIAESFKDFREIDQLSAMEHIEKISIPLLLVHGDIDRRVPINQSRNFVKKLEGRQVDYQYIEQTGGDHHLSLEEHRLEFFTALDKFLNKHLSQ
ncbi:MAG: S9 family peptidase, partial [Pseudomonadota bacterium]